MEITCIAKMLHSGNVTHLSPLGSDKLTLLVAVIHDKYVLVNRNHICIITYFDEEINN